MLPGLHTNDWGRKVRPRVSSPRIPDQPALSVWVLPLVSVCPAFQGDRPRGRLTMIKVARF